MNDSSPKSKKKILTAFAAILITTMFIVASTVCPVVRSNTASAEATENENAEVPNEVLNDYIEEEMGKISEMTDDALQEEFGITKEEYDTSMGELAGTTIFMSGDENGQINVEVTETIDRGKTGVWFEGHYFCFGIDSIAWTAIKWWFEDDCINMLVDQICQNDINLLEIAEKELAGIIESINALVNALADLDNTLKQLEADLAKLLFDAELSITQLDETYNDAETYFENMTSYYEEIDASIDAKISDVENSISQIDNISAEKIVDGDELTLRVLSKILFIHDDLRLASGDINEDNLHSGDISQIMIAFAMLAEGNIDGAKDIMVNLCKEKQKAFIVNCLNGEIDIIAKELADAHKDLKLQKQAIKKASDAVRNSMASINEAKRLADESLKISVADQADAEKRMIVADNERIIAENEFKDAELKYNSIKNSADDLEIRYKSGEVEYTDYLVEKSNYEALESDYKSKKVNFESKVKAYDAAHIKYQDKMYEVTKQKRDVDNNNLELQKQKKILKDNKISEMKTGLKAAKTAAKATAKATAKASCKGAICATGIGAVLMIALDIVMALLIKFIEDHLKSKGCDLSEPYGVYVKIQILADYVIDLTFKIFWRTVHIYMVVTLPCIPRLDGLYVQ